MNLVVANLKARVMSTITQRGPITFSKIARALRIRDEERLNYVLQELRQTGQIHFLDPKRGWVSGLGNIYQPMQRFVRGSR